MIEAFKQVISVTGYAIEAMGVAILVLGIIRAFSRAKSSLDATGDRDSAFSRFRHEFAQSTLVAMDFLIAGDIIRTVIVTHSIENILVLALLVTIRTALVFTLHLELEGRWPWQQDTSESPGSTGE